MREPQSYKNDTNMQKKTSSALSKSIYQIYT